MYRLVADKVPVHINVFLFNPLYKSEQFLPVRCSTNVLRNKSSNLEKNDYVSLSLTSEQTDFCSIKYGLIKAFNWETSKETVIKFTFCFKTL